MTPTEQDKELQKEVYKHLEFLNSPKSDLGTEIDHIMQLIIADRKRVALEARVEAAEHIQNTMVSPTGGYCDEISPNEIPDYIAELKAQQEQL